MFVCFFQGTKSAECGYCDVCDSWVLCALRSISPPDGSLEAFLGGFDTERRTLTVGSVIIYQNILCIQKTLRVITQFYRSIAGVAIGLLNSACNRTCFYWNPDKETFRD